MSFVALVICAMVGIYWLFFRQSRQTKMLSKIPGPPPLPILGNALELNVSNDHFLGIFNGWQKEYGNRIHFQISTYDHHTLILQAQDAEKILSSNTHIDKSVGYDFVMPWLGTGLITSQGHKSFHRRKMLAPAFNFKILEDFIDVFNEQSATLIEILSKEFGDGKAFNIFPYVTRCALDIICETAMGRKIHAQQERDTDYVKALYRISELIQYRQVRPWFHPNLIWKLSPQGREEKKLLAILHGFTEKVIAEKKKEFETKKLSGSKDGFKKEEVKDEGDDVFMKEKRRVAFLDLLLTAQSERNNETDPVGPPLTDQDIREETDTLMFAGHDTTAASVNWTTFLLGGNPDCQQKVHEELDEIFGDDKTRPVTTTDISKMKYLDVCIKESLRLYPSVPVLARSIKTDLELDSEIIIPAGTTANVMLWQIHRDPRVYPEPEVFLPDRFFPEKTVGRNPFAYIPFSAGPRNCIGQKFAVMEEKVMLSNIFRNFKVVAAERREDLVILAELIMRPKNGLSVKLIPRK